MIYITNGYEHTTEQRITEQKKIHGNLIHPLWRRNIRCISTSRLGKRNWYVSSDPLVTVWKSQNTNGSNFTGQP
jgi:hypothetical protein